MTISTKNLINVLLLAFIMQSCTPKAGEVIFKISEKVTCEQIDTIFIGFPLNMSIYKNELFIGDFNAPMIVHYNLKERTTDRFLSKGRGPEESLPPVQLYANPFGNNKLYRYSKGSYDMGFYPLDSLSLFVPLFKVPFVFSNMIPYDTDRYLAAGRFNDEYRYRVLNTEGTIIGRFGDYPDFLNGESLIYFNARAMFHQVSFSNSYPKKKLVAASNYVVDIIDYSVDITNESIKRVLLVPYDYEYAPESGRGIWAQAKRGMVKGVSSVACDDTYIYLLFNPGLVREENIGVKREIWVFNWDGRPVKKLILDADVREITADPFSDDRTVFGVAYESDGDDEHYIIVKIKL